MVIVELLGGLGNQLFQYAAARQLAELRGVELKVDVSGFEKYKLHKYSLHHFNISANSATKEEVEKFKSSEKFPKLSSILSKIGIYKQFGHVYRERYFHFDPLLQKAPSDILLSGFWQSEKYFQDISNILYKEFQIITPFGGINEEISLNIISSNSVSLHIRRGDYVSDSNTSKIHGVCDLSYYERCIKVIEEKVTNPQFFVFSDDPDWASQNLKLNHVTTYIRNNNADTNYEDLRLMSLCSHNIIANSSFSWWSAWLNMNSSKIVMAPKQWFNESNRNTKDLIPERWIKI